MIGNRLSHHAGVSILLMASFTRVGASDEWPPVTKEELALKDAPVATGAPALLLLREQETDDSRGIETNFRRIKILTEEGKKYADVEILFHKGLTRVDEIKARVVAPNGNVRPFNGEIFEKIVSRKGAFKLFSKTFALPDVEVGCILDIRYKIRIDPDIQRYRYLFPGFSQAWIVQSDLPTLEARFGFRPLRNFNVAWTTNGVDVKEVRPVDKAGFLRLTLVNIPAFVSEPNSPPADFLKQRVDFFYATKGYKNVNEFWMDSGKDWHTQAERFIGRRKAIAREAEALLSPSDSPEERLRKLYARAQQIRNLSWEDIKTEAEDKRENLKDNQHIEDVSKRGYGYRTEINRFFVGLARAAGFEAGIARVCERDDTFFRLNLLDAAQLNYELAVVRLNGEERYFDPGTPFCPFGQAHWSSTGVTALRLNDQGGEFSFIPDSQSGDATIYRKADLTIDEDGRLKGKIEVVFEGQEALVRRLDNIGDDEAGRRQYVQVQIEKWLPVGAVFKMDELTGWDGSSQTLRASGSVEVADYGVPTGKRLILPVDLFATRQQHPFPASSRVHPIYNAYAYQYSDEVVFTVPESLRIESLPQPDQVDLPLGSYSNTVEASEGSFRCRRLLSLKGVLYPAAYYSQLRSFFDKVQIGDQLQAVLATEDDNGR